MVDPADTRGLKNEYITLLHRMVLGEHLAGRWGQARLLDFGCGVGRLTGWLSQHAALVVGVDRDLAMLREAPKGVALVCGDGCTLPFASGAFGAIVSVGVLQQMDEGAFWQAAGELARCVAPGGVVALIEQTGRGRRPEHEYRAAFGARGLRCAASEGVRQGRWPLIYALRYGLVPRVLFPVLARLEWALTRRGIILLPAYHDRFFCFHKP